MGFWIWKTKAAHSSLALPMTAATALEESWEQMQIAQDSEWQLTQ